MDLYGLIVESIAKNPPLMVMDIETLYDRIINLIPADILFEVGEN